MLAGSRGKGKLIIFSSLAQYGSERRAHEDTFARARRWTRLHSDVLAKRPDAGALFTGHDPGKKSCMQATCSCAGASMGVFSRGRGTQEYVLYSAVGMVSYGTAHLLA